MKLIENTRGLGTGDSRVGLVESLRRRKGESINALHNQNKEETHHQKAIKASLESEAHRKERHKITTKS